MGATWEGQILQLLEGCSRSQGIRRAEWVSEEGYTEKYQESQELVREAYGDLVREARGAEWCGMLA